jgi:hypothetical protein
VNWSRNHRKAISFAFIILGNAAILSGCAARSRGFSFEDYKSNKEVLIAQEKLQSMFPPGTDVEEFTKFMKELRASCKSYKEGGTGIDVMNCQHVSSTSIATSRSWVVEADFDNERKITKLGVTQNLSAL